VRKIVLAIGLAIALAAVAVMLRNRDDLPQVVPTTTSKPSQTPSTTVSELLHAADQEDADAYLQLTGGKLRQSLEQMRSELGPDGFREHLRGFADGVKGVAVFGEEPQQADEVTLDVEFIFADRNERQRVTLARRGRRWVVTSMEKAQMVKPPIRYGTPVFEEPPAEEESQGSGG
jgi:hypothetical protein